MSNATMLKLEREKLYNAIQKAHRIHPRVKPLGNRRYSVTASDGVRLYFVQITEAKGSLLAECRNAAGKLCPACLKGWACFHVASAAAVDFGLMALAKASVNAIKLNAATDSVQAQPSRYLKGDKFDGIDI
jgi:hypothetical protein